MSNIIILDLETTGLDANKDKIIECSAIKIDKFLNEIDRIDFVCNPGIKIPNIILNLTGIGKEEIENSPPFEEFLEKINNFIQSSDIIVGHNIKFDIGFLSANSIKLDNPSLDTCTLAGIFMPGHESYALEVLSDVLNIDHEFKHRALGDVLACHEILKITIGEIRNCPKEFLEKVNKISFQGEYIKFIKNSLGDDFKKFDEMNLHSKKINKKTDQTEKNLKNDLDKWNEIMQGEKIQTYIFEWNSKEKLIEKIQGFYDLNQENSSTVIVPNYCFKEISKIFGKNINIIEPPYLMTNNEKIKSYLKETGFNKNNEGVLLKILFTQSTGKALSCLNINIAHDDFKIWNKFFALKNDDIIIKEKNIIEFSAWQKNHDKFKNHKLLFVDPNPETQDGDCIFGEGKVLDTIENEKDKIEIEKIFIEIKNEILKDNEMSEYGVFFEVSNEMRKSEKFESILNLLKNLKRLIGGEVLLEKQKNILRTFINKNNYYNFLNINSNLKLSIHSLKINLLENIEQYFKTSSIGFFSGSLIGNTDYQKKFFEIDIRNFENDKFPKIKINYPDLNYPGGKNPEFAKFSFDKLLKLINENKNKKICIFSKSRKQIENLQHFLNEQFEDIDIFGSGFSGGVNKLIHKANHSKKPLVLIGNSDFFNRYLMSGSKGFDLGIIMKLPFDNPNGVGKLRRQKYNNSFGDFALPRSVLQIKQFVCASGVSEIFFMDNRVIKDNWAKIYVNALIK